MTLRTETFTHTGWFGVCPVYLGDLESDAPRLTPRMDNNVGAALYYVSHYTFMAFFTVMDILAPAWQPGFPLMVTGELLVPHTYEYDDEAN